MELYLYGIIDNQWQPIRAKYLDRSGPMREQKPALESREVPSGMTPWPWVDLMTGHRLVLEEAQKMQSATFLHSGV